MSTYFIELLSAPIKTKIIYPINIETLNCNTFVPNIFHSIPCVK